MSAGREAGSKRRKPVYCKSVMDISFDIRNSKGDQVRVALSYYDAEAMRSFTGDLTTLSLVFYDVTLLRLSGEENVGMKTLNAMCDVLYRFMNENEDAVLCFYCDDMTDVKRSHTNISPQEYRSRLFSRMFDKFVQANHITSLINYIIKIEDDKNPRFAHFITQEKYLSSVKLLADIIKEK